MPPDHAIQGHKNRQQTDQTNKSYPSHLRGIKILNKPLTVAQKYVLHGTKYSLLATPTMTSKTVSYVC